MTTWENSAGWFALAVRPNHEQSTARGLGNQGLETYLPVHRVRRRWSDRIKESDAVLFPGYVFCRFGQPDKLRVLQSPGVRSIVGHGKQPVPVEDDELTAVRALIATGATISPWPYLRIGQSVRIERGPLAHLRGVILRAKNAWRVVVSVEALGASVAVEVDNDMISPDPVSPHGILTTGLYQGI